MTVAYNRCETFTMVVKKTKSYTCADYREEMMLVALRRRLTNRALSKEEKQAIQREIEKLESAMDMD
ncbi:MAG: hypothetical protein R6U50_09635 [Desulfobacterales bacterium]